MVSNFRRIKNELGDEFLHFAMVSPVIWCAIPNSELAFIEAQMWDTHSSRTCTYLIANMLYRNVMYDHWEKSEIDDGVVMNENKMDKLNESTCLELNTALS